LWMNFLIIGNKMKHMKTLLAISASIFLSVLGCTDNEVEMKRRDYTIQNNTDFSVKIEFYNVSDGTLNNQTSDILNNNGSQLANKVEQDQPFTNSEDVPIFAHVSDSVRIIFNNEKFYINTFNTFSDTFSEPINRNIFRHSNYENLGNERYLFKITQEDYENAEDCNGNCD
jgi:hypothetical protein